VALLIIFTQFSGLKVSDLFFHPCFSPNPYVAFLTRTFQILCSVPVIVCTFTYGLAQSIQPRTPENQFILFSALLTGGFLLNEIYIIHIYMVAVGISQLGVSLLYAVVLSSYGWFFRRELQFTPYQILLAGLGLLFFAIGVDSLHLKNKIFSSLLEGVPKLFSEINIAFYYWYVCKSFLPKAFYKNIES
jgi:FtsH-binding integral membrane protein